jgi:hypothetical protein
LSFIDFFNGIIIQLHKTLRMNKLIISLAVILSLISCKGPGSGPLVRQNSKKQVMNQSTTTMDKKSAVAVTRMDVKIEPCSGCTAISNLLSNKQSLSGKLIRVKGVVTKFNPQIMGKNWIHIQDGSEFQGGFDLTITSDKSVSIGDTVTFEGKLALDKDFGYGYFYPVLMEDGNLVN